MSVQGVSGHMDCGSAWHGSQQCVTNEFELEIKLKAKGESKVNV